MRKNKKNYLYCTNVLFYKLLVINYSLLVFESDVIIISVSFVRERINAYRINCYMI